MNQTIREGDCLEVMAGMDAGSVDAIVTDPPYGLSFMGKGWDHGVPGEPFWAEALRVAKPGAHLLAFGGTRTFHRLACAIEDAGWEIRDCLSWLYGSGFPKSHNLDGEWHGYGTALKPAWEPIILARKPLAGTVANNAQTHGVGAINVDGCRVEGELEGDPNRFAKTDGGSFNSFNTPPVCRSSGRWPANVVLDESAAELLDEQAGESSSASYRPPSSRTRNNSIGLGSEDERGGSSIAPDNYGDSGGPSRFFYSSKASGEDRIAGNNHPTIKPVDLMRWLVRMVAVMPGPTVVLDPFCGSGSTGVACVSEGVGFIGIEKEPDYAEIARRRITATQPILFSCVGGGK